VEGKTREEQESTNPGRKTPYCWWKIQYKLMEQLSAENETTPFWGISLFHHLKYNTNSSQLGVLPMPESPG
jgi:hypothetical protein